MTYTVFSGTLNSTQSIFCNGIWALEKRWTNCTHLTYD